MGLFGSKKKTIRQVGYSKLFPEIDIESGEDLFNNRLVQSVATFKTMDSMIIGTNLLEINKHLQYKAFQELDGATYEPIFRIVVTDELIEDNVVVKDPDFLAIQDTTTSDDELYYGRYYLTQEFGRPSYSVSCPDTWTWNVNGNDVVIMNVEEVASDPDGPYDSYEVDVGTCWDTGPVYVETLSYPYTASNIIEVEYTYSGTQDTFSAFLVDDASVYLVDDNLVYLVDPSTQVESTTRLEYLLQDDVEELQEVDGTFLTASYKTDFIPNTSKYVRAINSRMGIPNYPVDTEDEPEPGSMQESIDDPETKHMMLTYCIDYREPYSELIDELIGDANGYAIPTGKRQDGSTIYMKYVEGTNPKFYDPETGLKQLWDDFPLQLIKDGEPTDFKVQYMIPMEWMLLERNLVEKHDDIQLSLTLFAFMQKTVKLKWYQTGFFQVLGVIFAIGVFLFTGNPALLIGLAAGYVISKLNLSPIVAAILSIVVAFASGGFNFSTMLQNPFATMVNLINKISTLYFDMKLESIREDSEYYDEETEALNEAIDEIQRKGIYIPLDSIQNYYDSIYSMQYQLYEDAYDYDKIYYNDDLLTNSILKETK